MSHRVLGEQFLSPEALGKVRASDFPGHIGDPDPIGRMEGWQAKFGGTGNARHYPEGETPSGKVEAIREHLRSGGEVAPIRINHWKASGYMAMEDGHHRAVAAHLENLAIPAVVHEWDDI